MIVYRKLTDGRSDGQYSTSTIYLPWYVPASLALLLLALACSAVGGLL